MKIYVLVDNTDGSGLRGEWGLSFYIEYNGKTVPDFRRCLQSMRIRWGLTLTM